MNPSDPGAYSSGGYSFPRANYQLVYPPIYHPLTLPIANPVMAKPIQLSRRKCTIEAFDGETWTTLASMELPDNKDELITGQVIYSDLLLDLDKIKQQLPTEYHILLDSLLLSPLQYKENISELKITYTI